jgi:hypothetical protein
MIILYSENHTKPIELKLIVTRWYILKSLETSKYCVMLVFNGCERYQMEAQIINLYQNSCSKSLQVWAFNLKALN